MEDLTKLFELGDKEHKGFIIRRDMQRLQGELGLSSDELEAVFDSLDSDAKGYLTLDKFLLGYSTYRAALRNNNTRASGDFSDGKCLLLSTDINNALGDISDIIFVSKTASDYLKSFTQVLTSVDSDVLSMWELVLFHFQDDMKKAQDQIISLENLLSSREIQHKNNIRKLYEELEVQMRDEQEKIVEEGENKFNLMKQQLEEEVATKDQEIKDLVKQNNDLVNQLNKSKQQEEQLKSLVKTLGLDQGVYASQLESLQQSILDVQYELETVKKQTAIKSQEDFWRGYKSAQMKSSFEEDSFLQQLKILKSMQSTLSEECINSLESYKKSKI